MKLRILLVLFVVLAAPFLSAQNLVTNPGCEAGSITGWTTVSGTWSCAAWVSPIQEGSAHFFAGANALAEIYQDVDVSDFALSIDASEADATFIAWVQSYADGTPDEAQVIVEARDPNDVVLESVDSGLFASVGSWLPLFGHQTIPAGTRTIRIRMITTRNTGGDNDGYFDAVMLTVTTPNMLQNGGCETAGNPPPSWIEVSGDWQCTDLVLPPAENAAHFFAGSVTSDSELYQDVDVSGAAGVIDAGEALMMFGDYLQSYPNAIAPDPARVIVELRDGSDSILTTYDSGEVSSVGVWEFLNTTTTVTPLTRTIRVRLLSVFENGTDNDGYHDGVSLNMAALTLDKPAPEGIPGLGETLTYTVTATNVGSVTLTDVEVSDPALTPSLASCAVVLPGETCVLVGTYEVTQLDLVQGQIVNSASATGTAPGSNVVSAPAATVATATLGAIPTLDTWALLAMILALAGVALMRTRRG